MSLREAAGADACIRPRGVEDAAPYKQPPAVMMRVDASIDPYNRGATQCLTA
ncbi:hypothetical protein [Gemmiger sp.]